KTQPLAAKAMKLKGSSRNSAPFAAIQQSAGLTPAESLAARHLYLLAMGRKFRGTVSFNLPEPLTSLQLTKLVDSMGRGALAMAACAGQDHLLASLIQMKAHIDASDNDGNTALMLAAARGQLANVALFVEEGAHLVSKNKAGQRAVDVAPNAAIRLALAPPTVRRLAGLPRPPPAAAVLSARLTASTEAEGTGTGGQKSNVDRHKLRLEGLPTGLPTNLLEDHILALLRLLGAEKPSSVKIET
ncbi:unnamed protein product, partial [Polarella glacialis]